MCLFVGLANDLQNKLHGQHLAQSVVLKAIQGFINHPESNKPLTLSFHGWSGTGKNFVARMVADNLYRDGVKSECVRLFIAPFHFHHARMVDTYKVRRKRWGLAAKNILVKSLASSRFYLRWMTTLWTGIIKIKHCVVFFMGGGFGFSPVGP